MPFEGVGNEGIETGHDSPLVEALFAEHPSNVRDQLGVSILHVEDHLDLMTETPIDGLGQSGNLGSVDAVDRLQLDPDQLFRVTCTDVDVGVCSPSGRLVVHQHGYAVLGQLNVEFDQLASLLTGFVQSG